MRRCTRSVAAGLETDDHVLPAAIDGLDPLADQLGRHLERVLRPRQARIEDLDVVEAPAGEHGLEAAANGLDFGQLGHAASVVRSV